MDKGSLGKIRKRKILTSTRSIALATIEMLTCRDDFGDHKLLSAIYRYAHVGVGHCLNKHEDWEKEMRDTYSKLISED